MKGLIFTYLLTGGGTLASLVRPYVGLLVYVCFAIIKPDALWFWSVPAAPYSRIVAIGLLIGWILHGCGSWSLGKATASVIALVFFLLWAVVLSFGAVVPIIAWNFIEEHFKIILPFVAGVTMIRTVDQLKQLAWVIALSQGYLAFELNMSYLSGWNQLQEVGFAGMDNNTVAITMVACIGLAFFLGLHAATWWRKGIAFAAALFMTHAVMFSFSRGGLLALIITGGAAFVLIRKRPAHYLALTLAVLIGIRLAGPEVLERFWTAFADSKDRDGSAQMRVRHWEAMFDCLLHRPFGIGPSQWQFYSPSYGLPGMEGHSYWIQTAVELGLPGVAAIVAFYGFCVVRLWPLARERVASADPWLTYVARMVIASIVGFGISAQFVSVTGVEVPFYIALLGVGALKLSSLPTLARGPVFPGARPVPAGAGLGQGAVFAP